MLLHPNPITEERSAGEGRTRINREYANPLATRPQRTDQAGCRGRFADSGCTRQADHVSSSGIWRELLHDHRQSRRCILDPADQATQRPRLAQSHSGDNIAYIVTINRQGRIRLAAARGNNDDQGVTLATAAAECGHTGAATTSVQLHRKRPSGHQAVPDWR